MHLVRTEAIRSGMRLGKTIATYDGRVLLRAGTMLQQSYIQPLIAQGISAVYINTDLADYEPTDVISRAVRSTLESEMITVLHDVADAFASKPANRPGAYDFPINVDVIQAATDCVVDDILRNPDVVFNMQDIRTADEYTLGHCVNVCVLSTLLGSVLEFTPAELRDLATGALLHDIGKVAIPPEILNKPGPLTPAEMEAMKQHTTIGWMILTNQRHLRYTSSIVALQHHERWSGGGYPRGISSTKIYKHSQIVAIADAFDAITADRVYKPGVYPADALSILLHNMAPHFQPGLPQQFARCIAPYPVGAMVEITGGKKAVVVATRRDKTFQPRIRIVLDEHGQNSGDSSEIELSEHPDLRIVRTVVPEALSE